MPARALFGLVLVLAACEVPPRTADAGPVDSLQRRPGYVIDSIFPMEEMLRRFREPFGEPVQRLAGGAATREELVASFVRALADRDEVALQRMRLDEAEFAWIYFPSSRFAVPPYELPPQVLWLQLEAESAKGATRAMKAVAPQSAYVGHECGRASEAQGTGRVWSDCVVRWRSANGTEERFRLFGSILEQGGHFKFVSYANRL